MNDEADDTKQFEAERSHLFGIAYRMLGSAAEADDVLQETFIRWSARTERDVDSPRGFLTTTLVRLCLDQLKSARAKREAYVGPWLPEPILDTTPEDQTARAESINIALLSSVHQYRCHDSQEASERTNEGSRRR